MKRWASVNDRPATVGVAVGVVVGLVVAATAALSWFNANSMDSTELPNIPPVDIAGVYDPYQAGEPMPTGYFPIYERDVIEPMYRPVFVGANEIDWPDDADVIGVEIDGRSRAYPVGFLSGREIVNDEVAGVPILVTW